MLRMWIVLSACSAAAFCGSGARAATLAIVDNIPGTFVDISGTGTPLNLSGDDEAVFISPNGNAILPAGPFIVGNNGGIGLANPPDTNLAPNNQPIPSIGAYGNGKALLPQWDDIGNTVGNIYAQAIGDTTIVQWDRKRREGPGPGPDPTMTFQVQVFETVDPNTPVYAQFLYADIEQPGIDGGASATIGYQDGGFGNNDVQWSFDTPFAVTDGTVLSLVLVPEPAAAAGVLVGALLVLRRRGR